MSARVEIGMLSVDSSLARLIEHELCPGTGIEAGEFWSAIGAIVAEMAPRNRQLLDLRDSMQAIRCIGTWRQTLLARLRFKRRWIWCLMDAQSQMVIPSRACIYAGAKSKATSLCDLLRCGCGPAAEFRKASCGHASQLDDICRYI
jgi:malate synthase